jgi:hypothetical protein
MDHPDWHKFITVKLKDNRVKAGERPLDYYGPLKEKYEAHNREYLSRKGK